MPNEFVATNEQVRRQERINQQYQTIGINIDDVWELDPFTIMAQRMAGQRRVNRAEQERRMQEELQDDEDTMSYDDIIKVARS